MTIFSFTPLKQRLYYSIAKWCITPLLFSTTLALSPTVAQSVATLTPRGWTLTYDSLPTLRAHPIVSVVTASTDNSSLSLKNYTQPVYTLQEKINTRTLQADSMSSQWLSYKTLFLKDSLLNNALPEGRNLIPRDSVFSSTLLSDSLLSLIPDSIPNLSKWTNNLSLDSLSLLGEIQNKEYRVWIDSIYQRIRLGARLPTLPSPRSVQLPSSQTAKMSQGIQDLSHSSKTSLPELARQGATNFLPENTSLPKIPSAKVVGSLQKNSVQTISQQTEELVANQLLKRAPTELSEQLVGKSSTSSSLSNVTQQQQQAHLEQLASQGRHFMTQHAGQLQKAQQHLSKLKQKYKAVQSADSIFIGTASLKDRPLGERLVYGLNFQWDNQPSPIANSVSSSWATTWRAAPLLGYRINKHWTTGISGQVRSALTTEPLSMHTTFSEGQVFIQRYTQKWLLQTESSWSRDMMERFSPVVRLGLGRSIILSKQLQLHTTFLYDIWRQTSLSSPRYQVRIGILRSKL